MIYIKYKNQKPTDEYVEVENLETGEIEQRKVGVGKNSYNFGFVESENDLASLGFEFKIITEEEYTVYRKKEFINKHKIK